jgi:hypothetical protein
MNKFNIRKYDMNIYLYKKISYKTNENMKQEILKKSRDVMFMDEDLGYCVMMVRITFDNMKKLKYVYGNMIKIE